MIAVRPLIAIAALALAAGACSKPAAGGSSAAANGGSAPAAAASGPDVAITQADLPRVKAGQWQRTETEAGGTPKTSTYCDAGKAFNPAEMRGACQSVSMKRSFLGAYVFDATCAGNGMNMTMHMEAKGDFNSAISVDMNVTEAMAGQAPVKLASHSELKYLGPCPAGEGAD